jgi:hypothetical protein
MIEDVLAKITGIDTEIVYEDPYSVCEEHFNMDFNDFEAIINKLLPLCAESISPLTKSYFRGFEADGEWLYKQKIR